MSYQVIARKWRPQRFEEVTGQEPISRTLQNAIRLGRLHHAYLFSGPRGCGKTTSARILAKALNCHTGVSADPCGVCQSCIEIAAGVSIDVLEIDAASNTGVDNVRDVIINTIAISPARDRYKVFIIDEVHMLSTSAFNALLKTLEEPPPHAFFILATTELHKVPQTILSRCQQFEFRTIAADKIAERLRLIAEAEQIEISASALMMIALAGQGSMRDAQSAFDQVISFAGKKISDEDVRLALGVINRQTLFAFTEAIASADQRRLVFLVADLAATGYDLRQFVRDLMTHLRHLLVLKTVGAEKELLPVAESEVADYQKQASLFSSDDLVRLFTLLTTVESEIRVSTQPRYNLEMGLIRMAQAGRLRPLEELVARVVALEERLETPVAGGTPAPEAPPPHRLASRQPAASEASPPPPRSIPPSSATTKVETSSVEAVMPEPPPDIETQPEFEPSVVSVKIRDDVALIKEALDRRKKMMLLMALETAEEVRVDAETLLVRFQKRDLQMQKTLSANEKLIAEVSREVLGRELRLKAIVGSEPVAPASAQPEQDPTVELLLRKFKGEIVQVRKRSRKESEKDEVSRF